MQTATRAILGLLTDEPQPWSVDELAREIGDLTATLDAVAELQRAGLANRINRRYVCISRAARRAAQITDQDD